MDEISVLKNVETAMVNSYDIIVGNTTIDEMFLNSDGKGMIFAHDIEKNPTLTDLQSLKDYFEKIEDFEKCIELSKLIKINK